MTGQQTGESKQYDLNPVNFPTMSANRVIRNQLFRSYKTLPVGTT